MMWLPKNKKKRNQFFLILAGTVLAIAALTFGFIRPQYAKLAGIQKQIADTRTHLTSIKAMIHQSETASNELNDLSDTLTNAETDMATGDMYAWTIETMRHFKANYRIDVPDIGQPSTGDMNLIPHFPYKQLQFTLRGSGYYHDIGKFIADFENRFPHMRVVDLEMSPVGGDSEKLSFSMEIIALVKSTS
jgi:hypothetical protein